MLVGPAPQAVAVALATVRTAGLTAPRPVLVARQIVALPVMPMLCEPAVEPNRPPFRHTEATFPLPAFRPPVGVVAARPQDTAALNGDTMKVVILPPREPVAIGKLELHTRAAMTFLLVGPAGPDSQTVPAAPPAAPATMRRVAMAS